LKNNEGREIKLSSVIERVSYKGNDLAIILRADYRTDGIQFFTPDDFSQQLAYMNRPQGYVIPPHIHNPVAREVLFTKEVLFIRSGKVRVDFYDDDRNYLESRILYQGDVVLLADGGHGFEMLEASEMIEVKQGPYAGETDKTRFLPVPLDRICLIKEE
jgi:mannose-6-phosphate isomerase-like protein (cupin superfamily)